MCSDGVWRPSGCSSRYGKGEAGAASAKMLKPAVALAGGNIDVGELSLHVFVPPPQHGVVVSQMARAAAAAAATGAPLRRLPRRERFMLAAGATCSLPTACMYCTCVL